MWLYLLQGIGYGLAAASQPGPFQTYLISQTLTRGWKRTLPAALAPLVSDGPIILICVLVLSQVPAWMQRVLYIAGGLFILYLAYGTYDSRKNFDSRLPSVETGTQQSILKAALMNALSPGPYIFWTLVTGPILLKGWRETPVNGIGFLIGFYVTLISSLAALILIFGTAAKLGPKFNRMLLGISTIALTCFGLYQLWLGIFYG
ncbi:LysE family transporter [Candidatus Villigracilis saccharophilus]|uniref:LysE family translocator n=1 Tax=Candidatus Villigracilis saccharophilus TaxID=3140684 RepID=UPI003135F29F|nr:LysE family transporter [Anaerolineales bacterium]